MNSDTIQTLLRTILKFGGGFLVSHGIMTTTDTEMLTGAAITLAGIIWGVCHRNDKPPATPPILLLAAAASILALQACSRFRSVQIESRQDGSRTETKQTIMTFFDSKTEIAKIRASTSDKVQGLTVGGFAAESSGSNAVELVDRVVKAAVSAGISAAIPIPK